MTENVWNDNLIPGFSKTQFLEWSNGMGKTLGGIGKLKQTHQ